MEPYAERLKLEDYEEMVDFINLVFSQAHCPHDFEKLLPKIIRRDEKFMNYNLAVKRDGRIRALVGMFPLTFSIAGHKLSAYGIGNVSSHLNERGFGLMKLLMTKSCNDLDAFDADLSFLGGYRQRYNVYGYELGGTVYSFTLTKLNLRRYFYSQISDISFKKIDRSDLSEIDTARKLYYSQPVFVDRDSSMGFYDTLISWKQIPYAAYSPDGRMIGYLDSSADNSVLNEFIAESPEAAKSIAAAFLAKSQCNSLNFNIQEWDIDNAREFSRFCESYSINRAYNFRIRKWDNVIRASLDLKKQYACIPNGEFILGIKNYGNIRIGCADGPAYCEKTSLSPCVALDRLTATRLLFGPLPVQCIAEIPSSVRPFAESLLPLPINVWIQDRT